MSSNNKTNGNRAKTQFNKILDPKAKNRAADETSGLRAAEWMGSSVGLEEKMATARVSKRSLFIATDLATLRRVGLGPLRGKLPQKGCHE
jgi:hypothetical protein